MSNRQQLLERSAELVAAVSEQVVPKEKALEPGLTLADQGMTSLTYLRLIDALETEFGVYFDFDEEEERPLNTLDQLVDYMLEQGATGAG
ncbi:acyl carrier protein [Streptomyces sp. SBST2-5]|mgnify:CR=1 FL=1|uniref:Acyl carrier protein n=1 Tax=Streptomyces composti TaxID=2720025 RepID=A0ABX1AB96_9ACTN|nr:acyl carrier protein [Streptomyces composti]NJP52686.1 acyl carrier protein [Streptomyces composti]